MKTKKPIFKRDFMLQYHTAKQKFVTLLLISTFAGITGNTQKLKGSHPHGGLVHQERQILIRIVVQHKC